MLEKEGIDLVVAVPAEDTGCVGAGADWGCCRYVGGVPELSPDLGAPGKGEPNSDVSARQSLRVDSETAHRRASESA